MLSSSSDLWVLEMGLGAYWASVELAPSMGLLPPDTLPAAGKFCSRLDLPLQGDALCEQKSLSEAEGLPLSLVSSR